jgi:hypothetical protein
VAQTYGPSWHFFGRYQNDSFHDGQASSTQLQLAVRAARSPIDRYPSDQAPQLQPQASYATYVSHDVTVPSPSSIASLPGMPVFVLTTGTILSVTGYGYTDSRITYSLIGGGTGVISADDVDWTTTTQLNAQRGVRVTLHNSHANAGTPGF